MITVILLISLITAIGVLNICLFCFVNADNQSLVLVTLAKKLLESDFRGVPHRRW